MIGCGPKMSEALMINLIFFLINELFMCEKLSC